PPLGHAHDEIEGRALLGDVLLTAMVVGSRSGHVFKLLSKKPQAGCLHDAPARLKPAKCPAGCAAPPPAPMADRSSRGGGNPGSRSRECRPGSAARPRRGAR